MAATPTAMMAFRQLRSPSSRQRSAWCEKSLIVAALVSGCMLVGVLPCYRAEPTNGSALAGILPVQLQAVPPSPPAPLAMSVTVNATGVAAVTSKAYLGVNIDAASLYQGHRLDFQDVELRSLAHALAAEAPHGDPMVLRIGGSAADYLSWGANSTKQIHLDAGWVTAQVPVVSLSLPAWRLALMNPLRWPMHCGCLQGAHSTPSHPHRIQKTFVLTLYLALLSLTSRLVCRSQLLGSAGGVRE